MSYVIAFGFGLIVGSFLNVVIYRFGTGRGVRGRSFCLGCRRTLAWYELVPVFSFLAQRGMCRTCHSRLSWQYPLVEFFSGVLFLLLYHTHLSSRFSVFDLVLFLLAVLIVSILVVVFVYDLRHKIIPDQLSASFALLGGAYGFVTHGYIGVIGFLLDNVLGGVLLFLPFYTLWAVSRGRWIGLGDGKLAIGMGLWLGLSGGISAFFISFWIGAVVALCLVGYSRLMQRARPLTMKSELPFGPFLVIATLLVYFLELRVVPI